MPASLHLKGQMIKNITGKSGYNAYLGLSATPPTEKGENITEPKDGGYARTLIGTPNYSITYKFPDPPADSTNGEVKVRNNKYIYFDRSIGPWTDGSGNGNPLELTHFVIFDSATGGHVLAYGELKDEDGNAAPIKVETEKTVVLVPLNGLTISVSDTTPTVEE